jgi:hypothetical protein
MGVSSSTNTTPRTTTTPRFQANDPIDRPNQQAFECSVQEASHAFIQCVKNNKWNEVLRRLQLDERVDPSNVPHEAVFAVYTVFVGFVWSQPENKNNKQTKTGH